MGRGGGLTGVGGEVCLWRTWACTVFRWAGTGLPEGMGRVDVMGEAEGVLCMCC